jgi:hypothetical protein
MLCDQFDEWINDPLFIQLPNGMGEGVVEVSKLVKRAPRFVLDRAALLMTQDLSMVNHRSFVTALNVCRLPFPTMWVEFAFKDRHDWLMVKSKAGLFKLAEHELSFPPNRLGFFMAMVSGNIIVQPVWSHTDGAVDVCRMAMSISLGEVRNTEAFAKMRRDIAKDESLRKECSLKTDADVDAYTEMAQRVDYIIPTYMQKFWEVVAGQGGDHVHQMTRMAQYDLGSEWRFVLALLTILNSRNLISYGEESDPSKQNKARSKKGKPLLLSHREINLDLSPAMKKRLYAGAGQGSRNTPVAHIVRGHWKLRKTGLFWWSPHTRNSEDEMPDFKTYKVTA